MVPGTSTWSHSSEPRSLLARIKRKTWGTMHQNSIRMRPRSPTMTSAWSLSWNIGISAAWMHMNAPIDCRWFIHRGAISMVHKQDVQMIITIPTQPLYFFFTRGHCFFVSLLKGVSRCFWWGFAQPRNLHFNKTWGELKEVVAMFEVRDPSSQSVHATSGGF